MSAPWPAKHMRLLIVIVICALLASCDSVTVTGPNERLVVGTVAFFSDQVVIEVPDTVSVSVPFSVSVHTFGGGCKRVGPTEVVINGLDAEVTPFDYTMTGDGVVCTDIFRVFEHEASLTFAAVGSATVTIRGKEEPGDLPFESIHPVWVR